MPQYKGETELRKILFELESLAKILKDDLHTLIGLIPRNLDDIGQPPRSYQLRYTGQHEEDLTHVATQQGSSAILLLFEEWGTSGRVRPTLNHLFQLLVTAELFRAADHLADNLLRIARPARPTKGPAAPIDTELPLEQILEQDLDGLSYPNSSELQNEMQSLTLEENLNRPTTPKRDDVINFPNSIPPDSMLDGILPSTLSSTSNNETPPAPVVGPIPDFSALINRGDEPAAGPSGVNGVPNLSMFRSTESVSGSISRLSESGTSSSSSEESVITNGCHGSDYTPSRSEIVSHNASRRELEPIEEVAEQHAEFANGTYDGPAISDLLMHVESAGEIDVPNLSIFGPSQPNTTSNLIMFSSIGSLPPGEPLALRFAQLRSASANFDSRPFTNGDHNNPNGRLLGSGGFGEVFLGFHLANHIPLAAIKRLFPSNYQYEEKFNRERDLLTRHQHPNIVRLLGYSNDEQLSLVYEYLPDGSLEGLLRQSRENGLLIPVGRRLNYLIGIARAIEFLHHPSVNIIHRDITLGNILLYGEVAKLCDFGLIRSASSLSTTRVMGTGAYLAPEALRGTVSTALDIYSFGVVIAEVATGEEVLSTMPNRDDEPDLLERVTARDADLESMVDRRVEVEMQEMWIPSGRQLLELANDCLKDRLRRPVAGIVLIHIEQITSSILPQ